MKFMIYVKTLKKKKNPNYTNNSQLTKTFSSH